MSDADVRRLGYLDALTGLDSSHLVPSGKLHIYNKGWDSALHVYATDRPVAIGS
jgi:hypothetical protein